MPRRRNRRRHKACPNDGQWCKGVGGNPLDDDVKNTGKCEKSDKECEYEEQPVADVCPHENHPEASLQRESNADDENRTTTRTNIISCKINTNTSCELWQSAENTPLAISLKHTYTAEPLGEEDCDETLLQHVRNVVNLSGDEASTDGMMGQQQSTKRSGKSHRKSPNPEPIPQPPAESDDPHSEEYYEAHCDSFKCSGDQSPAITTLSPTHVLSDNDSGCEFSERLREDNDIVEDETEEFHTTFNYNPIYNSNLVRQDSAKSDTDRVNSAFDDGKGANSPKYEYDMMPHINGDNPTSLPDIVGNAQTNLAEK